MYLSAICKMRMCWPTGDGGGGGGDGCVEVHKKIEWFMRNGREQMNKEVVTIWCEQTNLLFTWTYWYRIPGSVEEFVGLQTEIRSLDPLLLTHKYWPIEGDVEKYETARKWVIIE